MTLEPSFGLTLLIAILTVGVQYGVYQAFKAKTEIQLKEIEQRMTDMETKFRSMEMAQQKVVDKLDAFYETTKMNLEKIFDKIEEYDKGIRDFYKELPKLIKENSK